MARRHSVVPLVVVVVAVVAVVIPQAFCAPYVIELAAEPRVAEMAHPCFPCRAFACAPLFGSAIRVVVLHGSGTLCICMPEGLKHDATRGGVNCREW